MKKKEKTNKKNTLFYFFISLNCLHLVRLLSTIKRGYLKQDFIVVALTLPLRPPSMIAIVANEQPDNEKKKKRKMNEKELL
jgi:hypothetical protein